MDNRQIQRAGAAADDEIEIDLMELFYALKKKLWVLILTGVLGAAGAFFYSDLLIVPQYTSTSKVFVLSKETTLTSLADLQIGSQLTKDYAQLVTSRTVMQDVIDTLGLEMGYRSLRGRISIDNPTDTRILNISVTDPDPVRAKQIADAVAYSASEFIADIMEQTPPKIIEEGEIPQVKTSPSVRRNTMLGGIGGIVVAAGIISLLVIMDDAVTTEDDLIRASGLPVLAVVPEDKKKGDGKRKKQK